MIPDLLDHVVRQWPSEHYTTIKRSYFNRGIVGHDLHKGVEAVHGVYQSIRLAEGPKKPEGQGGLRMVTNVDVSYAPFWHVWDFTKIVGELTASGDDVDSIVWRDNNRPNKHFDSMRRLKDSGFTVECKGMSDEARRRGWKVAAILDRSAREYKFRLWDDTNKTPGREVTILEYYSSKYQVHLAHPNLPVVQTTKMITKRNEDNKIVFENPIVFPMELCKMQPNQRYLKQLDDEQTKRMVENAIQPPQERLGRLNDSLKMLSWHEDPYLGHYRLKINPEQIQTDARILYPPKLQFKDSQLIPEAKGEKGTWNLTEMKFISTKTLLAPWGVMALNNTSETKKDQTTKFVDHLVSVYKSFGGKIATQPLVREQLLTASLAENVKQFYDDIHNQYHERPQILLFILPTETTMDKTDVYLRIKNTCDCQLGVYSQCVQAEKAFREPRQYAFFCNLLMKFNAKLGGATNGIVHVSPAHFLGRTMIIGADVSHPAPGSQAPSYAAMTVSMDSTAMRYAAAVETNGFRKEMVSDPNITKCLTPLIKRWKQLNKHLNQEHLPDHVYYFRDGVSEDQFKILLDSEVASLKRLFNSKSMGKTSTGAKVKFTVVVAAKRHHIRFFPQGPLGTQKDGNGNPLPGTIVEHDVTDPKGNDIYLCSHRAIKGTARPTRYIMLMDEKKVPVNIFQKMLYEQCYQYIRSTTAVSLHPAVYYAHLASKRAQAHDSIYGTDHPKGKQKEPTTSSSENLPIAPAPLLPIKNWNDGQTEWIGHGMWFI